MKKLLLTLLLLSSAIYAESIDFTFGAMSQHKKSENYKFNSNHEWFGIKYKIENKALDYGVEASRFKNSYFDNTTILSAFASKKLLTVEKLSMGIALNIGLQKGYNMKGLKPVYPHEKKRIQPIVIPSIFMEYKGFGINISSDGNNLFSRFSYKVLEF